MDSLLLYWQFRRVWFRLLTFILSSFEKFQEVCEWIMQQHVAMSGFQLFGFSLKNKLENECMRNCNFQKNLQVLSSMLCYLLCLIVRFWKRKLFLEKMKLIFYNFYACLFGFVKQNCIFEFVSNFLFALRNFLEGRIHSFILMMEVPWLVIRNIGRKRKRYSEKKKNYPQSLILATIRSHITKENSIFSDFLDADYVRHEMWHICQNLVMTFLISCCRVEFLLRSFIILFASRCCIVFSFTFNFLVLLVWLSRKVSKRKELQKLTLFLLQVKSLHLLSELFVSIFLWFFPGKIEFKFHNFVFFFKLKNV